MQGTCMEGIYIADPTHALINRSCVNVGLEFGGFTVGIISLGAAGFCESTLIFGKLHLLFGLDALFLGGSCDSLRLYGVRRVGLADGHGDELDRETFLLNEDCKLVVDFVVYVVEC